MKIILSIFLTFSLLFSQLYVSITKHYCGGKLKATEIALTKADIGCGMEKDLSTQNNNCEDSFSSDCCETTFFTYVVEEDYHAQEQVETPSDSFVFTPLFVYLFVSNFDVNNDNTLTPEPPQPPPPTVQEVLSYVQVYRL